MDYVSENVLYFPEISQSCSRQEEKLHNFWKS